ncbi:hypothetical protein PSN45_001742 [Yamadazyma tenuis]|uniref:Clc chloride channel n=1 Tax=Candida tenuis (strain ATCC 10573 / BCRC 21748 / CBS 615 / JCM 9827 / NBRC 10315 / NRRL Y-1498 / VKM Y-70) TaxID=590646 RepID=G3BEA9_CANTC|nr:Clc chloride channel [Yamadazyma tenuis ATCC 10573]EGV60505.1 Clc chloride channel [Yamadazyma tenuis ATCC 10573]WEJ94258.1 hypothetical protein PSN45_001742 [Yamadazyma tenuis]
MSPNPIQQSGLNPKEELDFSNIDSVITSPKRHASTVPSSPSHLNVRFDKDQDKVRDAQKLNKIKSLGKIDIRSPIINHVFTSNSDLLQPNDDMSLYTPGTHTSVASRILSYVPETLYSIRNYYNDFTTIDWADAFIKTNRIQYELHHKHWITEGSSDQELSKNKIPLYYRAYHMMGRWVLIVLIAFVFSLVAYAIDKFEILFVGIKHGYCSTNWLASQVACCSEPHSPTKGFLRRNVFQSGFVMKSDVQEQCPSWISWSTYFSYTSWGHYIRFDYFIYVILSVLLAVIACFITLTTEIANRIPAASTEADDEEDGDQDNRRMKYTTGKKMYTAAGSGVPEVKTILSGFVIRRFLGTYTFLAKTTALVFAIASGMALGKEGPYVHLATAVGNILSRLFPFVSNNELIQKQILSAAASSGVALAFGSPLGGVLFILEEINHSLPSFQLFQIFFCAIISTLFLKFLDPYGTGNTVLFELNYTSDWNAIELIFFIIIGLAGGVFGALFVKFVAWWPKVFRSKKLIQEHPMLEVVLIAAITGIITFWNPYTKQATTELVLDLATPCSGEKDRTLCPTKGEEFIWESGSLLFALIIKIVLTFITFGLRLPMGVYVPSMVIGALFGRLFGTILEWINYTYSLSLIEAPIGAGAVNLICQKGQNCIDLGIYSMIGAGAFMAGVTRMNITLVTILFEITSSYTYVLPISISIAVANWMGNLIEQNSLYESLLIAYDYPFMSPETEPIDPLRTAGDIIETSVKYNDIDSEPNIQRIRPISGIARPMVPTLSTANLEAAMDQDSSTKMYIDITSSPYVLTSILKQKLLLLASKSLLDGCIALIKSKVCVGIIFFPELEICIDKIDQFCMEYEINEDLYCIVGDEEKYYFGNPAIDTLRDPIKFNLNVLKSSPACQSNDMDYFIYHSVDQDTDNNKLLTVYSSLMSLIDFTKHINYSPIFLNYNSELSLAHLVFDKIGNRVIVLLKDGQYYGVLHKKTLIDFIRRDNYNH